MNTRFKMALLLHAGESGFAIVIAVSLGLIMVLVGLTMTMRSQGDQVLSSTQKQTEQALAASEKGVAFYQEFFNVSGANRRLAQYPDCKTNRIDSLPAVTCSDKNTEISWSNVDKIPGMDTACNVTDKDKIKSVYASTDWKDVNNPFETDKSKFGSLQFRLVSYQYKSKLDPKPSIGTLTVEGRVVSQNNSDVGTAINRIEVNIPVKKGDIETIGMPGVWIGSTNGTKGTGDPDGTGKNNGVKGDILINNCNIDKTVLADIQTRLNKEGNYQAKTVDIKMPSIPDQPQSGNVRVVADASKGITDKIGMIPLDTLNKANITLPQLTTEPIDSRFAVNDFNGDPVTYAYTVTSIGQSSIKIKPGYKIAIWLSGNIDKNTTIQCEDADIKNGNRGTCNPLDLKIFGTGGDGSEICVNGNNQLNAFILAPKYNVGVDGGGNLSVGTGKNAVPTGNIRGAVWAKQWAEGSCGSNAVNLLVEQSGDWSELKFSTITSELYTQLPPKIYPAGAWQKKNLTY